MFIMELEGVEVYSQGYYYTSESAATGSETSAAKEEVSNDENQSVGSSQKTGESANSFFSFKEDSNKDSAKDTAQTSTQTNILAWSVLGIASLGALLAVLFKRKHQ